MTFGTFSDAKGLFAIMARTAGFASFHISHLQGNFLHFEKLGLGVAIGTLGTCISMNFTIENDFAIGFFIKLNFLAGAYCHDAACQTEKETSYNCEDEQSFHKNLHFNIGPSP